MFHELKKEKKKGIQQENTVIKLRPCLVTIFVFNCHFLVFKGKRKKKFCFQNEKHIWLVVLKNTFSKNKIQEICLVVVFERVEFCFVWLIFI